MTQVLELVGPTRVGVATLGVMHFGAVLALGGSTTLLAALAGCLLAVRVAAVSALLEGGAVLLPWAAEHCVENRRAAALAGAEHAMSHDGPSLFVDLRCRSTHAV